jgi:glycosyltransferase involved in cell wall biosynthesis
MLKVHLLFEHDVFGNPHGCSYIRLIRPFFHPSIAENLKVTKGLRLPDSAVDVVIVERSWCPEMTLEQAQELVSAIRKNHSKFIYTLDDNLLDLHVDMPWETFPTNAQRLAFRYFIREADGVIVSTINLQRRLINLNKNTFLVPNALDERLFPFHEKPVHKEKNDVIKVGYMGTRTHASDLLMILAPLREFLRKHDGRVVLEIVGVFSNTRMEDCFAGCPVEFLDVGEAVEYEKFIPWAAKNLQWDFALAPLKDNMFNQGKSDIKFLDYAMLGIPGIYSDVPSYHDSVSHKVTGWLCANEPDAWLGALDSLFVDAQLRKSIALNASKYAFEHRTLGQCAHQWFETVENILRSR